MSTHRLTVQFDARLSFNLNLPADDARLVRDRTPLSVVVERVRNGANDSDDSNAGSVDGQRDGHINRHRDGERDGHDSINSLSGSFSAGLNGSISPGGVAKVASPCASYALILRVGRGEAARDYPQAEFVHRSAAEGAGQCLIQYLAAKPELNVETALVTEPHPIEHEHPAYTAVGWSMSKGDRTHPDGSLVCGPRHSLHHSEDSQVPLVNVDAD